LCRRRASNRAQAESMPSSFRHPRRGLKPFFGAPGLYRRQKPQRRAQNGDAARNVHADRHQGLGSLRNHALRRAASSSVHVVQMDSFAHAAVPKSVPTPYVTAIASALQNVTRITPGKSLAPPVCAASAPRSASATRAAPATAKARCFAGARATTASGRAAPAAKLIADAPAACSGRAVVISESPNSSRA
jgi:hypothetical protein